MTNQNLVKINFPIVQDETGYPDVAVESLWARPCGDDVFQIDNIPFFAKRVSFGDKVTAKQNVPNGSLCYKEHVEYSKHSTIRVILFDENKVQTTRDHLKKMGCSSELSHIPKLIAIDIPPKINVQCITHFLAEGEKRGDWEYEEASVWE